MTRRPPTLNARGFTLIEVLVALLAMALMAGLGWRGIDGLVRAREASQTRMDRVAVMQTALAQWQSDLDAHFSLPGHDGLPGLSWDGRVLRILRRASVPTPDGADAGLWVVSWTLRALSPDEAERIGLPRHNPPTAWVRTQSAASTDRPRLQQHWAAALQSESLATSLQATAVLNPSTSSTPPGLAPLTGPASVAVLFPAQQWQLFYYRGDAWSNPLSSSGTVSAGQDASLPDGVRLILTLPEAATPSGTITLDWVRPNFATPRS